MRLLDEEDVIKTIQNLNFGTAMQKVRTIDAIRHIPTAFDFDGVLARLKHEEAKLSRFYMENKGTAYAFSSECQLETCEKTIEIIKGGVVDGKINT